MNELEQEYPDLYKELIRRKKTITDMRMAVSVFRHRRIEAVTYDDAVQYMKDNFNLENI